MRYPVNLTTDSCLNLAVVVNQVGIGIQLQFSERLNLFIHAVFCCQKVMELPLGVGGRHVKVYMELVSSNVVKVLSQCWQHMRGIFYEMPHTMLSSCFLE